MKKRLRIILLGMLVILWNIATYSLAANEQITLTTSEEDVKSGDTFEVTVSQTSDGIVGVESNLSYDTNVFTLTEKKTGSDWKDMGNNTKLDAIADNAINSGEIFKLTFSVNENVSATTSEIKLTGIKMYRTSSDAVNIEDKAINVKVNEGNNEDKPSATLSKIEVTKAPSTTSYEEGEKFNADGMVVTATYSDNTNKTITDYTYSPNSELKKDNKLVTISYTENNVTKSTTQAISVSAKSSNNNNNNNDNNNNNNNNNNSNNSTELKGITLDKKDLTLVLGTTTKMNLIARANPSNATLPEIVWSSSNEKVAKIEKTDTNGSITVVSVGTGSATITAKTRDGKYSATCKVTVKANGNTAGNNANTTNVTKNATSDNTTTSSKLPKTGSTTKYILLIIVGLMGISFVTYKAYRKYKEI